MYLSKDNKSQKGLSVLMVVVGIGLLLVIGVTAYLYSNQTNDDVEVVDEEQNEDVLRTRATVASDLAALRASIVTDENFDVAVARAVLREVRTRLQTTYVAVGSEAAAELDALHAQIDAIEAQLDSNAAGVVDIISDIIDTLETTVDAAGESVFMDESESQNIIDDMDSVIESIEDTSDSSQGTSTEPTVEESSDDEGTLESDTAVDVDATATTTQD